MFPKESFRDYIRVKPLYKGNVLQNEIPCTISFLSGEDVLDHPSTSSRDRERGSPYFHEVRLRCWDERFRL